jgi:predicted transposase/invertase (TIGR01784 family)
MRRDTIFYQIFQQFPTLLFDIISNPPSNADRYTFDSIEVKETSFRIDGVFLPPNNSGLVYFCEVQFQLDELLYERIVSEIGIYVYRNRDRFTDWRAFVIYPSRSIEQSNLETVEEMLVSGRIQRVYLDELGEIETLPVGLGLMVLTTLEGDLAQSEARRAIIRAEGNRDIIEMITKIFVYKFNALSRDEVDAMLEIELQQTRVYREAVAEGEAKGLEIGQQQERALVFKQLGRKLGKLPTQLEQQVAALSIDRVESLGEALLDFATITDLETWLSDR